MSGAEIKDSSLIAVAKAKNGWVISRTLPVGPIEHAVARSRREVLLEVAIGLGLEEIPMALRPEQDIVERALLLLGSIMAQMVKKNISVLAGEGGTRTLDPIATSGIVADIRDALIECGYKLDRPDQDQKPGT